MTGYRSVTPGPSEGPGRLVEQYDTLVELDVAVFIREQTGWVVLSAGQVRPGRWWAEYERVDGSDLA